ncbi:MAG: hypothetical protein GPOALKHO_000202 [Sodalis sp.]|nr:MAG: hypothetical protein GPOALKHO_000202 [Sodalis sp.]
MITRFPKRKLRASDARLWCRTHARATRVFQPVTPGPVLQCRDASPTRLPLSLAQAAKEGISVAVNACLRAVALSTGLMKIITRRYRVGHKIATLPW